MKNIYIIILTGIVLVSCTGELDLKPQQSLSEEVALSSDSNVKKALAGAYDGLSGYNYNLTVPSAGVMLGGDLQVFSELLASNGEITWVGTFNQFREVFGKTMLTTNTYIRNNWTGGYYTINICNNVLSAIDNVLEADQDRVKGEALFIRGVAYFELVKFFAKPYSAGSTSTNPGIPIVLTPTKEITAESLVARSSVEQVYQQILSDLNEAVTLLTVSNGVYANKMAAYAMLSRVYLQMANYSEARDAANAVIESGEYELTDTYAGAFNNFANSSEDIFAMQTNDQDGDNNLQLYWSIPDFGGRDGDVEVLDKHLNLYEDDDDRLALFYEGNGGIRSGKWKIQYTVLPIVRLAEMYLTRAESNFRMGTSVGDTPENDVNRIRARVGLADLIAGEVTLDAILFERKLELAHEGQGVHDLKRLKLSADGFTYDADKMVFPIPQREITTNSHLVQNSGYIN